MHIENVIVEASPVALVRAKYEERRMHIFGNVGDVSKPAWVELRLLEWERHIEGDPLIWSYGPGELRIGCEWYLDWPGHGDDKAGTREKFVVLAQAYLDSVAEEYQQ